MQKDFLINEPAFEITKAMRDDSGQMFIEGIAATTGVDLTNERMSPEAIAKMAAGLINKPLRSEHGKGWDDEIGKIIDAKVIDDETGQPALWIKAKLHDWSSKARDLFGLLTAGVKKMGLSVAGKVRPGGLVDKLDEHLGKWIPTYKDVDPTEVSVTDHPANIETFAYAVSKSLTDQVDALYAEYENVHKATDVTGANDSKPEEYKDVATEDFLDPENYKYPADEKHLLPALRYFNHDGQRAAGGYDAEKWAKMGEKLASKLGDGYTYDPDSEKVVQETQKREGVNEMDKRGQGLVTKELPKDVSAFVADMQKHAPGFAKSEEAKAEAEALEKKAESASPAEESTSTGAPAVGDGSSSTTGGDQEPKTAKKDLTSTSSVESLLSTIASTLEELKEQVSSETGSGSTLGSDESTSTEDKSTTSSATDSATKTETPSTDSSTATGSTSTETPSTEATSTTSAEKAESSASTDGGEESALEACMKQMSDALSAMKAAMEKGRNKSSASSSVENDSTVPAQGDAHLSKSLTVIAGAVAELTKAMQVKTEKDADVIKSLREEIAAIPNQRKGRAVIVEKSLDGEPATETVEEGVKTYSHDEFMKALQKDPEIGMKEIHKYQLYGELPMKYLGKIKIEG